MKIEKDNACDRVDTCEEACKSANIRAQKAEDEVDNDYDDGDDGGNNDDDDDDNDDTCTLVRKLASPLISELKRLRMRYVQMKVL